jgi:predicted metalloprotease with PDZ domain
MPTRRNAMLWGNNLAHELYHIWIGGTIRGIEADVYELFDEGFTDYYADLALAQSGLLDSAMFLRKMEKVLARYVYFTVAPVYQRQTMMEASRRRGANRFGVYDGGWAAAFCLDGLIQEGSNGARALDDALGTLHERFGLAGHPFAAEDFVAAVSEAAGRDLADFFRRHVAGPAPFPLEACVARAGLEGAFQRYAGELWIAPVAEPSAAQRGVLRRTLRGPGGR